MLENLLFSARQKTLLEEDRLKEGNYDIRKDNCMERENMIAKF